MYSAPYFNCGPAIVQAMQAANDTPAGPSVFTNYDLTTMKPIPDPLPQGKAHVSIEECWGAQGLYRADNFQSTWRVNVFTGP